MANPETLQKLSLAVQTRNVDEVRRITSNLPDYSLRLWNRGFKILYNSISCNEIEIPKLLISRGCPLIGGTESKTALHIAVIKGDLALVQMLLQKGLSFNLTDNKGMTPVYNLAYRFSADETTSQILDFLVSRGANINSKHRQSGYTLLHFAALIGNFPIIPLLISKKCHLNARSKEGLTALHVAAMKGHSKIVSYFLSVGVKPNILTESNISPLCLAVESKDMATIEILLNRKLRGSRLLSEDPMLLYYAVGTGNLLIIELLTFRGAVVNIYATKTGKTPLHLAVEMGREDIVSLLLRSGANSCAPQLVAPVSEKNTPSTGCTALHIAAEKEQLGIVNLLLQHGAHPGAVDEAGRTPLHMATKTGSLPIVSALLRSNPNPLSSFTPAEPDGLTPLHIATENGFEDILNLFLNFGIPVQLSTKKGLESLHIAVQKQNKTLILMLLMHGADANAAGLNAIETPLFIAAEIGNTDILEILSEASSTRFSKWIEAYFPLYIAAYRGHEEIVKMLLRKGVDLKANLGKYLTPLHAAAQKGHEKIVDLLLESGAEVNSKNTGYFSTPLLAAFHAGHENIIFSLLNRGADFNVKLYPTSQKCSFEVERLLIYGDYTDSEVAGRESKVGYTPLHFAVEAGNEVLVKILLNLGANVNVASANLITPLRIAVDKKHTAIVGYLLAAGADVQIRDFTLHAAILKKNEVIVQMLLKAGVDVNTKSDENKTALGIALETHQVKIAEYLLKAGADINIQINNSPILNFFLSKRNIKVAKMLLKYGINVNARSRDDLTALSIAIGNNIDAVVKPLLEAGADPNVELFDAPILNIALSKNNVKVAKMLLQAGVNVNTTSRDGRTALGIAVYRALETIIQPLLDAGADPNAGYYLTPILNIALAKENLKIAEMLIKYDADVNAKSYFGITPLGIAVDSELVTIVQHLLEAGANANVIHNDKSVLQNAVSKKNAAIVEMLLKAGADANLKINSDASLNLNFEYESNKPAIYIAIETNNKLIVEMLVKHGADVNIKFNNNTPLCLAVEKQFKDIVQILLEAGADPKVRRSNSEPLLFTAILQKNTAIVDLLLKHNTLTNFPCNWKNGDLLSVNSKSNYTPLHLAVSESNTQIVELLLQKGSVVDYELDDFPLHNAIKRGENQIVSNLLKYGAHVNSLCKLGKTPLFHAVEKGFTNIAKLLLMKGASVEGQTVKDSLLHCALNGDPKLEMIKLLLDCGVDVDAPSEHGLPIYRVLKNEIDNESDKSDNSNSSDTDDEEDYDFWNSGSLISSKSEVENGYRESGPWDISKECDDQVIENENEDEESNDKYNATQDVDMIENPDVDMYTEEDIQNNQHDESEMEKHDKLVEIEPEEIDTNRETKYEDQTPEDTNENYPKKRKLLKLFLAYGANAKAPAEINKESVLHLATRMGNSNAVNLLIKNGADVNFLDQLGNSSLKYVTEEIKFNLDHSEGEQYWKYRIDYRKSARMIIKEIARLNALNEDITVQNQDLISSKLLKDFYTRCQKEVEEMQKKKICGWLTYFDILSKNRNKVEICIKNKTAIETLKSYDYVKQFPLYGKDLKAHIKEAKKRHILLEKSVQPLKKVLRFEFPSLIVEEIFSHLTTRDLRNLCISCNQVVFLKAKKSDNIVKDA